MFSGFLSGKGSPSTSTTPRHDSEVISSGSFYKCGASVKSWKKRRWELHRDGFLYYFELGGALGGSGSLKGKVDLSSSGVRDGRIESIREAVGMLGKITGSEIALQLLEGSSGTENGRCLEVN